MLFVAAVETHRFIFYILIYYYRNVAAKVTVFSAPPLGYGEVKEPAGWNPTKYDMKVLSVDESSAYEKKGAKKKKSKKKKE